MSVSETRLGVSTWRLRNSHRTNKLRKGAILASEDAKQKVTAFLEEHINSKLMPGKKDTITRSKMKMQKRLL